MRNILHVAEKNDAAKNIAAIMARGNSTRVRQLNLYIVFYDDLWRAYFYIELFDRSIIVPTIFFALICENHHSQ
jgi:hypothetical protein